MMRKALPVAAFLALWIIAGGPAASATTILWTRGICVDGDFGYGPVGPILPSYASAVDGMDPATGIGILQLRVNPGAAGDHTFALVVDLDIDYLNSFTDEYGATTGTAAAGQSWEIDDPFGHIWDHASSASLDNMNAVPAAAPFDVAMALAWRYHLKADQYAVIETGLTHDVPDTGFHLSQIDLTSGERVYFYSSLRIVADGGVIPEPATMLGMILGLCGLGGYIARRRAL